MLNIFHNQGKFVALCLILGDKMSFIFYMIEL